MIRYLIGMWIIFWFYEMSLSLTHSLFNVETADIQISCKGLSSLRTLRPTIMTAEWWKCLFFCSETRWSRLLFVEKCAQLTRRNFCVLMCSLFSWNAKLHVGKCNFMLKLSVQKSSRWLMTGTCCGDLLDVRVRPTGRTNECPQWYRRAWASD